jgi:hypothetical protein
MKAFLTRALVCAFPCVAMAQIAVLQIKVVEGEGAVHPAGVRIAHALTVEVTDESGHAVPGATVSFQLPPSGPSGLFSNGLRTDLATTDSNGRAAIRSVQLNRTGGPFRIRITAVKEQARAGIISSQFIGGGKNTEPEATVATTPAKSEPATTLATAKSGEITPTPSTTKVGSGVHKKWLVLAAVVAGGGVAFLGVSRSSGSHGSTVSSSVVSIGTPTITIGHP